MKNGQSALRMTDKRNGDPVKVGIVPKGQALPLRWLALKPIWDKSDADAAEG
ncbi:MAG: hypothetical protein AB3N09_04875 [Tateyamaria sp.]